MKRSTRIYRRPGTHGSNRSSRPPVVLDAPGHYDGDSVGSRATADGVGVSRGPQILFPFLAFEGEMAAPSALVLKCEACGAEAPHRVLRGKIGGRDEIVFEGTVKCPTCGRVSTVVTREPKPIEIPLIVSWLDKSERTSLEFSPEETARRSTIPEPASERSTPAACEPMRSSGCMGVWSASGFPAERPDCRSAFDRW